MTVREVAQRLRAWDAGHPLPRFSTLHHAIAPVEHTLVVAFVRMAGESRPWGIAWGHPGEGPRIASVPDGRIRDDVAELCADFAEALLNHLRVHNWTYDPLARGALRSDLRQVWLPNGQHVAMLHHLNYAYSQTKHGGANLTMLQATRAERRLAVPRDEPARLATPHRRERRPSRSVFVPRRGRTAGSSWISTRLAHSRGRPQRSPAGRNDRGAITSVADS